MISHLYCRNNAPLCINQSALNLINTSPIFNACYHINQMYNSLHPNTDLFMASQPKFVERETLYFNRMLKII